MKIVVNDDFCFSTTSGYGISGVIVNCSRIMKDKNGRTRYLNTEMNGLKLPNADVAEKMALEKGYLKAYGRNNVKFVMSPSVRKRGFTTNDFL